MMKGCSGCAGGKCSLAVPAEKSAPSRPAPSTLALVPQALASLLPPVLGFITAYALTALLFPESSGDAERAAAGVLGLLAAGALVCLLRARTEKRGCR